MQVKVDGSIDEEPTERQCERHWYIQINPIKRKALLTADEETSFGEN